MKKLVFLVLMFTNVGFAQGLIFSRLNELPAFLTMEKQTDYQGVQKLVHVKDEPVLTHVTVKFEGDLQKRLEAHLLNANTSRIYCDGDFSFGLDEHNMQYIKINYITVCIDDQGFTIANSFGIRLEPGQMIEKSIELDRKRNAQINENKIYQSMREKEGDISPSNNSQTEVKQD